MASSHRPLCWMVLGREQREQWPLQGDVPALHQTKGEAFFLPYFFLTILLPYSDVLKYMCCCFLWKCLGLASYCKCSLLIMLFPDGMRGLAWGCWWENRYKMTLQEDELGADLGWGRKLELFLLSQSCLASCLCSAFLKGTSRMVKRLQKIQSEAFLKTSQLRTLVNHWLWWNSSF